MAELADPLGSVFSFVERAYLRLQASDVLTHCLEDGNTAPLQSLVEELVIAGPQSLRAIREILIEVKSRKVQLKEDLYQINSRLEDGINTQILLESTRGHLNLLDELEYYIRDWLLGIMYQSIRQDGVYQIATKSNPSWLH